MLMQPKDLLLEMLRRLGFDAIVETKPTDDGLVLEVKCEDAGRLIGRQGQTLSELQYILNRLVFNHDPNAPRVVVDIEDYRAKAREALLKKAREAAEKVRRLGSVVELEPLSSYDRRIVHNALKDDPGIETQSVEIEGSTKKVVLLRPKR